VTVDEAIRQARQHLAERQFRQCRGLRNQVPQSSPRQREAIECRHQDLNEPVRPGERFDMGFCEKSGLARAAIRV